MSNVPQLREEVKQLEGDLKTLRREIVTTNSILTQSLSMMGRLGLKGQVGQQIRELQRLIMVLNQMRIALLAFHAARMAAGDPWAWATAGLAAGSAAISIGTMKLEEG